MGHGLIWVSSLLFLIALCLSVKTVSAQTFLDSVVKIHPPFELHLKKSGPVRLSGLLYDADAKALSQLIAPQDRLRVRLLSDQPDRYGRKPALVYFHDGRWVQGELVRDHHAIPYPYAGEEFFIRDLYELEHAKPYDALNTAIPHDQFAIVQGLVIEVAEIKGTTYLNFGANWRTDFTIRILKKDLRKFNQGAISLPALKGKKVQIRGWVLNRNGPMIEGTHPAQLQILSP